MNLELRGVNILVGPNGSGKTAVLESLILLRDTLDYVKGRVVNPFQRWWGYRNVAWRHDEKHPVEISLQLDCSACSTNDIAGYLEALGVEAYGFWLEFTAKKIIEHGVRYSIVVSGVGGGFNILREELLVPGVCQYIAEPGGARLRLDEGVVRDFEARVEDFASLAARTISLEKGEPRERVERVAAGCLREAPGAYRGWLSSSLKRFLRGVEVSAEPRGLLQLYVERERMSTVWVDIADEAEARLLGLLENIEPVTPPEELVACISRRLGLGAGEVAELLGSALEEYIQWLLGRIAVLVYAAVLIVGGVIDGVVVLRTLDYASIRSPQPLVAEERLREDGSNLVSVMFRVGRGRVPEDITVVLASVLNAGEVTGFFEPTPDGRLVLKLVVDGVELLPPSIPEGAWKTMALMTAVLSGASVIAVDEFENSLHPAAQELLLEELRRSGATVLVATHSPTVIDAAKSLDEIILLELKGGETRVSRVEDAGRLAERLRELGLTPSEAILYHVEV